MQPWFYFSYMEAKNPGDQKIARAVESERFTEKLFADIIAEGQREAVFTGVDGQLTASVLKAMLQDWYLKRGKYARRRITVERYADFLIEFIKKQLSPGHP